MSPVHSVQTMSDDELRKSFAQAQDHMRNVHGIESDHEDFDKLLPMHPFFKDVVDEYNKRNLGETLKPGDVLEIHSKNLINPEPPKQEASNEKKPTTITEIEEGCKLTEEEIEEGKKNLAPTEVPEDVGSEITEPVGQTSSTEIPKEMTDHMTASEVHQEEKALKEEGLKIQMGTEYQGPGGTEEK